MILVKSLNVSRSIVRIVRGIHAAKMSDQNRRANATDSLRRCNLPKLGDRKGIKCAMSTRVSKKSRGDSVAPTTWTILAASS